MQWVLFGAVILALLLMASRSPKIALSLFGVLLVLWIGFYYYTEDRRKLALDLVDQGKVTLGGFKMTPGYRDSFNLSMRINNDSTTETITEVRLQIDLEDCSQQDRTNEQNCIILGSAEEIVSIIVPPRQARDITRNTYFGTSNLQTQPRWSYKITGLKTN